MIAGAKELMYYDVVVIENSAYEGIMRLPLKMIYFVTSSWQVTRWTLLWCDTNKTRCLQKDLVEAVTVSNGMLHNRVTDLSYLRPIVQI